MRENEEIILLEKKTIAIHGTNLIYKIDKLLLRIFVSNAFLLFAAFCTWSRAETRRAQEYNCGLEMTDQQNIEINHMLA